MNGVKAATRACALKKLTRAFEGFMGAGSSQPVTEHQRSRNTRQIGHWLDQLSGSSPLAITDALFQQMKEAQRRGNTPRLNAQTVLLALLVEHRLAVELGTYSAFMPLGNSRQDGS